MGDGGSIPARNAELRTVLAPLDAPIPRPLYQRIVRMWRTTLERLTPLGGFSDGNRVQLYTSGDDAFTAMLAAIEGARRKVWLETYIFEPDALGCRILGALTDAARRGCEVVFLYDVLGSPRCREESLQELREAGGRAVGFNPFSPFKKRFPLVIRDHRKILVVDDEIGFCGGMNISVDYAGPRLGNCRFRDTHARVVGPAVKDLAEIFRSSWQDATGELLAAPSSPAPCGDGVFLQVLSSGAMRKRRHIQRALMHTIRRSVVRCFVTSAYFVPPKRLKRALMHAARRGVDVRVLTAGRSDVPLVALASRHIYGKLLKAGVRIYEMTERTLHAKTATIDGVYSTVGSFNLDRWSDRRLLEVNVTVLDEDFAARLEHVFQEDLQIAHEVRLEEWKERSWRERILCWVAYQLARM